MSGTEHNDTNGDEQHSTHSPTGFEVPEPELSGSSEVACSGCGTIAPIDELGVTADEQITANGAVVEIRRVYLHNDEDCIGTFLADEGVVTDANSGEHQ